MKFDDKLKKICNLLEGLVEMEKITEKTKEKIEEMLVNDKDAKRWDGHETN